jgi:PKD repeat protein
VQCVRRSCSFDGRASVVRLEGATWRWRFSDNETAEGATVSRAFTANGTITAELTVRDAAGQTATASVEAVVTDNAPIARVTGSCARLACSASAATSTDDGRIVSYRWEWSDGTVVTGASPTANRTVTAPGSYTVRVTVTDDAGQTGTASATVTATPPPPTARFTVACNGRLCTFDASPTTDPAGPIASYAWTFGDGTTGTGVRVQRRYATAGTFTVIMRATGSTGAVGEARVAITVR